MGDSRHRLSATIAILILVAACGGPVVSGEPPRTSEATRPAPTDEPASSVAVTPGPDAEATPSRWSGGFHPAASMLVARAGFDAVILGDGRVLAVGSDYACMPGPAEPGSERTEVYDPGSDRWSEVGSLNKPRKTFATVVNANGDAMVIGGINPDDQPYSSTKVFVHADTDTWADGPLLERARGDPLAVSLPDGRTIVGSQRVARWTIEILDPANDTWSAGPAAPADRSMLALVALADGRALATAIVDTEGDAETGIDALLLDPDKGRWTSVGVPSYGGIGKVVAMPDGTALSVNGAPWFGGDEDPDFGRHLDRLDPATGTWTSLAPSTRSREGAQVAVLADGRLLVAGGISGWPATTATVETWSEIYDPLDDRWEAGPELLEPRYGGLASVLDDGSVLILGGYADLNTEGDTPFCPAPVTSVERWLPDERSAPAS